MRRLALISTVTAALAWAPSAHAATTFVVRGAGFGHGVGLSQYGAYGLAVRDRNHEQILAHYYRGTSLSSADSQRIRVLLQSGKPSVYVSGATRIAGKRSLDPDETYRFTRRGIDGVDLRTPRGRIIAKYDGPIAVDSSRGIVRLHGTSLNGLGTSFYRDAIEVRAGLFGGLMAVNALDLDDYVKGVVPGEVPATWPMETLKAQAVIARTYGVATDRGGAAFDQYPDTRSQVYKGYSGEHPGTNRAVAATAGQVLRYQGRIATTYYFSTSGGRTENIENVFYGSAPVPYLRSVEDPYDNASPRHRWRFVFSRSRMQARLGNWVKGTLRQVKVVKRGVSPRVVLADVVGSRGRTRVRGADLRTRLGLYDTWAYYSRVSSSPARQAKRPSGWIARLFSPRRYAIRGSVSPVPKARRLVVQRLTSKGWRTLRRARTSRTGRYRVELPRAGTYRVIADGAPGPATRVD